MRVAGYRALVRALVVIAVTLPIVVARPSAASAYGHATYHGGQVESTSTTYAIFWLPSSAHFEAPPGDDKRYQALIAQYFSDVGGTPYYRTLTQYSRDKDGRLAAGGPIRNHSTFGGAYVETTPYPHAGTQADPLQGADIRDEVLRAMKVNSWTAGIDHQFFVFTASGTETCSLPLTFFPPTYHGPICTFGASATAPYACGARDHVQFQGRPVLYALVPDLPSTCRLDPNLGPNQDPVGDIAVLIASSFQFDTVVDPVGTGWYHRNAWIGSIAACDALPNVSLHGHPYLLTSLWSNAQNRCVVRNPPPVQSDLAHGYVTYRFGSIMPTTTTYSIFWLPPAAHFQADGQDAQYEGLMNRFFKDVGGTSYYNLLTQYSTDRHGHPVKNGPIQNSSTLGGTVVDTTPYPRPGTTANPLRSSDMETEIARVMQANHWSPGLDKMYFLFLASGTNVCMGDPAQGSCTFAGNNIFCAYHNAFWQDDTPVIYGVQPEAYSLDNCRQFHTADPSPNRDVAADTDLSLVAHELFEAVTDPLGFGWMGDSNHSEIGDKCETYFGLPDSKDGANVTLHGDRYLLQSQWSNATRSCEFG